MKKSDELKLERTAKIEAQRKIVNLAKTEKRAETPEEEVQFDALQDEIEVLDRSIERSEKFEKNELRIAGKQGQPQERGAGEEEDKPAERFSIHRAIRAVMNGGELTGIEKEIHEKTNREAIAANVTIGGVAIPLQNRATAQTVTGDSGTAGGALVPTDLQAPIDFLRPAPLMEKMGATYLRDLKGNVRFPKNEGGIVATWEGETAEVDPTANTYGYADMKPNRLSVTVPISMQNLLQSSIDLEMYTINEINLAIANAMDTASVNGPGTGNQPLGVLNAVGTNTIATAANGSDPSWNMLVDAETSIFVENANAAKMAYLVNPKTRGKLKKTKHDAGDLNYIMGTDGSVNGYPSETSNHVPSNLAKGTGTNLSAIVFGDWSQLIIGQWGFMDLDVTKKAKAGIVEVTVNVFADVLVKQPKAFSVAKGIITT